MGCRRRPISPMAATSMRFRRSGTGSHNICSGQRIASRRGEPSVSRASWKRSAMRARMASRWISSACPRMSRAARCSSAPDCSRNSRSGSAASPRRSPRAAEGPGAPVRAFDFSETGETARAAFRPGGPLERSPLFFEVLHPKPIVGEMIVARLLDRAPPRSAEPGFGDPLAETAATGAPRGRPRRAAPMGDRESAPRRGDIARSDGQ